MSEAEFKQSQRAQERAKLTRQDVKDAQQSRNDDFENALKILKLSKERMTIRAPFDGQIANFDVWPGQLVGNGTVVAKLISSSRTVEAKISEENSAGIQVGQKAMVTFLPRGIMGLVAGIAQSCARRRDGRA